jgi:hypothetical protein
MSAPSPTSSRPHLLCFLSGCRRRPSPALLGLPTFNQCHQGAVKPPHSLPRLQFCPLLQIERIPLMAIKAAPPMAINGHCLGRRPLLSLSPIRVVPEPLRALFPQPWTPHSSHPRASTIADQAAAPAAAEVKRSAAAVVLAPLVPNSPSFLSLALTGPPGRRPRPRRHAAEAATSSPAGTRDPVRPSSSHVIYTAPPPSMSPW